MFLYASKILPVFVFPLGLSVLLLSIGMVLRNRPRARLLLIFAAVVLLAAFSSHAVSQALMRSLESQTPSPGIDAMPVREIIVVLADYVHAPTPEHPGSELIEPSDRLLHAVRLYRAGKAPLILLSGGVIPFLGRTQAPEGPAACALLQEWGVPPEAVLLENDSRNTEENAAYTERFWMRKGSVAFCW